jgi:hypothetical protein
MLLSTKINWSIGRDRVKFTVQRFSGFHSTQIRTSINDVSRITAQPEAAAYQFVILDTANEQID